MFSELSKAITAVVLELLLSGPNLILIPQPFILPLSFDLLSAEGNVGELICKAERVAAEINFSKQRVNYCNVTKPEDSFLA